MRSYSLSELCEHIGGAITFALPEQYWVRAEISSLSERGHCYMELVEKSDRTGILAAKLRATCWQQTWQMLSAYFYSETGQHLRVGMQVLLECEVSFHPVYGLSLNIVSIDPAYTMGDLARQRQQTIDRLKKDGTFEMQQSLVLPTLPRRIAIVSSPTAAGYEDFCEQIRQSRFVFSLTLFAAIMQGDNAAPSVIKALEHIALQTDKFDCVVIIRGGGANTDLSCFDDYDLCSVCAQFPMPILTGIGHQRDTSITDMVVFNALKTPTAVAAFLDDLFAEQQELIDSLHKRLLLSASRRIMHQQHNLQQMRMRLQNTIATYLQQQRNHLQSAEQTIKLTSPELIYKKGYTRTTLNGILVRSTKNLKRGELITTEFSDGKIQSVVQ